MKKLLLLTVLALGLLFPGATHANIAVTWLATSTDAGYTQPAPVNGNNPFLKILSISTSTFANGINITNGCFSKNGVCIGSGSGAVTSVFGRTGAVVATAGDYTTALVTEVTNLYFTNARAIAATLTGFSATTGTVSSTDSILVALEKLAGNAATYLTNVTGLITPGTNVTISGSGTSGSPYVINATGGGSTGLATSSPIASSNLLEYSSTGAGSAFGVATSTLSASSPLTGSFTQIGSGGALGIQAASASQNGYLSLTDYQLLHTATTTFTSPIIYTAGTNAVTCQTATGSVPGCLSAADWTTFNGKAGANYFTLTGNNLQNNTGNALGINTAPTIAALEVQASSTTGNAFTAWSAGGANLFSILNGGNVGIGTSTPGTILSIGNTGANTINISNTATSSFGFAVKSTCFTTDGITCITSGSGSGTVGSGTTGQLPYYAANGTTLTATSSIMLLASGAFKNANGDLLTGLASYVVSTTTATGNFTDVQSAINALPATGGLIQVRCGTYTLPSGTTGINIKVQNTIIDGAGYCTQFNFDKANTTNAVGFNTSGLSNAQLSDFYIHQTNATFGGIGINAANTPLLLVENVKVDGTATSSSIKDSANESFYQRWVNLDLRDNTSCFDVGGNPVNDNVTENVRCAPHSGNGGFAWYQDSSSANGAQAWTNINFDSEPTGASTGLTGLYLAGAVDTVFINPYIEGNAIGYKITSAANRITFVGGEFISNGSYSDAGNSTTFQTTDIEGVVKNKIASPAYIQDLNTQDATFPDFQIYNNTNFAHNSLDFVKFSEFNGTDSSNLLNLSNAGTGATLIATSSRGTDLILNQGLLGLGTSTPKWKLDIVDALNPQISISDGVSIPWDFRSISGGFFLATSSLTTFATSSNAVFSIIPSVSANATTTFSLTDWVLKQTSPTALSIEDAFGTIDALFNTASTTGSIFTVAATTSPSVFKPIKLFDVDQYGHLTASSTRATPTVSCAPSGGTLSANSNDVTGTITGGTLSTSCTVTFASAYASTPTVQTTGSNIFTGVTAQSTTAFTASMVATTGDVINYWVIQP